MLLSVSLARIPFTGIWYSTANYDYEGNWMIDPINAKVPSKKEYRYVNIETFLNKLLQVQEKCDTVTACNPNTFCSICLQGNNEMQDYSITVDGREIRWSKGLFHYYDNHGIVPSRHFYNIIMAYSIKKPRKIRNKKDKKSEMVDRDLARDLKYVNIN